MDSDSHLTFLIHNNPFGGDYYKSLSSDHKHQVQLENPSRMEIKGLKNRSFVNLPGETLFQGISDCPSKCKFFGKMSKHLAQHFPIFLHFLSSFYLNLDCDSERQNFQILTPACGVAGVACLIRNQFQQQRNINSQAQLDL